MGPGRRSRLQRKAGREDRARAILTIARLDVATVQFDEFPDERQPDAKATGRACRRRVSLRKAAKNARKELGIDSAAAVAHDQGGRSPADAD
jgi:hypothetical protein